MACKPSYSQEFRPGLRLGMNFTQIHGDLMSGYNKGGALAGLTMAYDNGKAKLFPQFEMLLSQKGSRRFISPERIEYGPWDVMRLDYVEIPVLINYRFRKKIHFHGGLSVAYLFHKKVIGVYGSGADLSFLKKYDLNYMAGAEYYLGDKTALFARASGSILPIDKSEFVSIRPWYEGRMYNIVAGFGLKYNFKF
jgi:hypothetical protein